MPIPEDMPGAQPVWTGYIGVEDVDDYSERVKNAGGTVYRAASDIPGVGRFAVVADPDGAAFILFNGTSQPPAEAAPGTRGRIGWHELHVPNSGTAFQFYADLFGWTIVETLDMSLMGGTGLYYMFATGGAPAGGIATRSAGMPAPFWLYYFNVDVIDAALDRVRHGGGKVTKEPEQAPGGSYIAHCTDPHGARFALVGAKR